MENNPYNPYDSYDQPVTWVPQQGQTPKRPRPKEEPLYKYPVYSTTGGAQRQEVASRRQQAMYQGTAKPARMSKAKTLELVDAFKKFLIVASIVGFGVLGGLAASHATGVTSSQAAPSSSSSAPSINSPGSQSPSHSNNSGGFFNQGNQGGYQFGSGNSQSPFTNSRTS